MVKRVEKVALERAAWAFREGDSTFGEYVAATQWRWEALSSWLLRKWRGPVWVDRVDVLQDLYLGAWTGIWAYVPEYATGDGRSTGRMLSMHAEYTAIDKAKKRLHKARGAVLSGNADSSPGRVEVSFSAISATPSVIDAIVGSRELTDDEEFRIYEMCSTMQEVLVVRAVVAAGGLLGGVDQLLASGESRDLLGIIGREDAGRIVEREAVEVARRLRAE